jgi:hypothetical protein
MSKEEISDDYVVVDQNTTGTAVTDDLVSKTNIAAALFKTVAVAAEQYSALKGLAAKYFVRCDKTDAPVGPKFYSMGYLILRDSHQFPIPPRHRGLPTAEDRFKHTGAKHMLQLLLPDTEADGGNIDTDNTFELNGLRFDLSDLVVIYTEGNQPVISSVELLFTHSTMLPEQLQSMSQTFHADRGLIREICLPLADPYGLEHMLETLHGQGYIANMLRGYDDEMIFDKLSEAWKVADTYGFHNCVHHMLDYVLNYKPFFGENAAWYVLAFCSAANKDNEFAEYLHKKIPPTVVSADKTTYDFADSLCITSGTIREGLDCPTLARKHLKTYVPELWSELVVAEAQRKFPGLYDAIHSVEFNTASCKGSTTGKSKEPISPDTNPDCDGLHDHDHDHEHEHDHGDKDDKDHLHEHEHDKSKRNIKHKCRHSSTEWEAIRNTAADYMFDELVLRPMTDTKWIYDVIQEDLDGCICGVTMYFDMEKIRRRQGGQVASAMMSFL